MKELNGTRVPFVSKRGRGIDATASHRSNPRHQTPTGSRCFSRARFDLARGRSRCFSNLHRFQFQPPPAGHKREADTPPRPLAAHGSRAVGPRLPGYKVRRVRRHHLLHSPLPPAVCVVASPFGFCFFLPAAARLASSSFQELGSPEEEQRSAAGEEDE